MRWSSLKTTLADSSPLRKPHWCCYFLLFSETGPRWGSAGQPLGSTDLAITEGSALTWLHSPHGKGRPHVDTKGQTATLGGQVHALSCPSPDTTLISPKEGLSISEGCTACVWLGKHGHFPACDTHSNRSTRIVATRAEDDLSQGVKQPHSSQLWKCTLRRERRQPFRSLLLTVKARQWEGL